MKNQEIDNALLSNFEENFFYFRKENHLLCVGKTGNSSRTVVDKFIMYKNKV